MKKKFVFFLKILSFCLICLIFTGASAPKRNKSKKIEVALFVARSEGDMFFQPLIDFMKEASNQLDMNITVYFGDGNHIKMIENVQLAVKKSYDFLVYINFKKSAVKAVEIAEENEIPIFIMNSGFQKEDHMGKPRENYKYWIGEMLPDDEKAGYILANILIDEERKGNRNKKVVMGALEGNIADEASIERKKGLKRAVNSMYNVELKQIIPANWEIETAGEKYKNMVRRYPNLSILWCASDGMALGAVKESYKIGYPIVTGGVDWTKEGLEAVENGKITASIGGHFMEGGWVAVLLYDYYHGVDFKDIDIDFKSDMMAVTSKNVKEIRAKIAREKWKTINFKKFSRYNCGREYIYNFRLADILANIK